MGIIEIFLTGASLAMDAFAASVCRGLQMRRRVNWQHLLIIALFFGGFQALMPALGYFLGKQFEEYIVQIDHWIAFILLCFLGGKMILDVIFEIREQKKASAAACPCKGNKKAAQEPEPPLNLRQIATLSIATSIDALAVGITFAFLELQISIWAAIAIIGVTTFLLCGLGVLVGHKFGARYKNKATVIGGAVLILIGLKILLEHLGVLPL